MSIGTVLLLVVNIGGFVLLVASGVAAVSNRRAACEAASPFRRWLKDHAWQVGILLGLLSLFSQYPLPWEQGWTRIYGLPFFVAELAPGEDHPHGPGLPGMLLNVLFWVLLPQFVLRVTSGRRGGRPDGGHPADAAG